MKNIVFFIDSLGGGGAERVVANLSNQLAQSGKYRISIVMLRNVPPAYALDARVELYYANRMPVTSLYGRAVRAGFSLYKKIRRRILKPLAVKLGVYDRMPRIDETAFCFYANYALPYREYLKKNPGCTAFGFLIRSNIAMLMAARGLDVKTVFCERNNPVRPDIPANIIRLRDRLTRRCASAVFQTREERDYYTWLGCETAVIPNPLKEDLPEPFSGLRRKEIVNFCRLNKQKNIPLLISAFEKLLREHPDYTLRIYGRGDEKENLMALTREKGLEASVIFEDFAPDVHQRIRDAAMYVCSSDFEGLSNSMLEAMAIGMPCVCTDCAGGGARMMIRHGENGLLTPVGDEAALYEAMKRLAEDPELAARLGREAAKVRRELSIEQIAGRWEAVIG